MKKNNQIVKQDGFKEFLIYTTPNGKVKIEINSLNSWKLEIYDNLGKTLDTIFGDKSKQINYKIKNEASNGLYYFKLKSTNGNLIDIKKLIITK